MKNSSNSSFSTKLAFLYAADKEDINGDNIVINVFGGIYDFSVFNV